MVEIRVNTIREKICANMIQRGLKVFGLTVDDIKSLKAIKDERDSLLVENQKLKEQIGGDADKKQETDINEFLKPKGELKV